MDDSNDPTAIVNSMKDLHKFLSNGKSKGNFRTSLGVQRDTSPRLKLSFSETLGMGNDDSFQNDYDLYGASFFEKHKQSIAGFDITKKLREKDTEVLDARAALSIAESKLQSLEASKMKMVVEYDAQIESLRSKQMRDKAVIEELEQRAKTLTEREREMKDEAIRTKKTAEVKCSQMEKKMLNIQATYLEKNDQLQEELSEARERVAMLEKEVDEKSNELHLQEIELKILEERVAALQTFSKEAAETQLELETTLTKLTQACRRNKELELRLEGLHDSENRKKLFENTINQLPVIQKQLAKLKEENSMLKITQANIGLLEEKLNSANSQIQLFETQCNGLTAENATLLSLRELSEKYEVALKKELELEYLPPVEDVVEILQALKKKDDGVSQSLSELKASLESHKTSKGAQEELVKSLRTQVERSEFDLSKNTQIIRRFQRKMFLLSKERDNLKDIISSYESESTINPSQVDQGRISHLESQLSDYKAEVERLEQELNGLQNMEHYEPKAEIKSIDGKKSENSMQGFAKEISELREENENLKAELEHHAVKGSYDPAQTKILQFLDNPMEKAYQERQAEQEKLLQENEALKLRVKLLEEGETSDLTQKVGTKIASEGVTSQQVKDLKEQVTSMETRNQRLIDAFKQKSQEMREVVYRLSGYKVDLRKDNRYRLSHVYSESKDDYLLFMQTEEGDLQLLETDFSSKLGSLIDMYLHQVDSYPAFLAALTLDLFGREGGTHSSSEADEEEYEGGEEEDEEEMEEEGEEREAGEEDEYEEERDDDEEREEDEYDERDEPPSKKMRTGEEDDEEDDDELICLD